MSTLTEAAEKAAFLQLLDLSNRLTAASRELKSLGDAEPSLFQRSALWDASALVGFAAGRVQSVMERQGVSCGKCVCPYCGNDEVDEDIRACCGEAHAFVCGERGVFCDECKEAPHV